MLERIPQHWLGAGGPVWSPGSFLIAPLFPSPLGPLSWGFKELAGDLGGRLGVQRGVAESTEPWLCDLGQATAPF